MSEVSTYNGLTAKVRQLKLLNLGMKMEKPTLYEVIESPKFIPPDWCKEVQLSKKPFQHQLGDIQFMRGRLRCGIWSEPGVGKTLPMQAHGIFLATLGNKSIFAMPPILVKQFLASLKDNFRGIEKHLKVGELSGRLKQREKLLQEWQETGFPSILGMSYKMFQAYREDLQKQGYNSVFVDEATVVKNTTSKVHQAVKAFADVDNGLVLVTGTPIETNVEDCYGLIKLIDPEIYANRYDFDDWHCMKEEVYIGSGNTAYKITEYINLPTLHENLMRNGRRVLKKDVSDLPPRLISEHLVDLSRSHQDLYTSLVEDRLLELEDDTMIDLTTAQALYQATQQALLNPEKYGGDGKHNELLDTLDTIIESLEGRKILVYCWYKESIAKLLERYKHLNPVSLNGSVTGDKREKAKQRFIEDDACKMLIANPKSGGVGVDGLQHVCSHVVYAEVCPFVGTFQQSIDRLHRTGQREDSVNIYLIVANNTIAVELRNRLVQKDEYQESVVKDKRTILAELLGRNGIQGSFDEPID